MAPFPCIATYTSLWSLNTPRLPVCSVRAIAIRTLTRLGTWNTTWFSVFWRQRISSTVTAKNSAFVNRILQRNSVFQKDGPSIAKASPYPRFYYYDPKLNRRLCNYRNPHSTRDRASKKQHSLSLGFTECGFSLFFLFIPYYL
jgi:hypothetical protein